MVIPLLMYFVLISALQPQAKGDIFSDPVSGLET
jgi:hypothetical protein